MINFLEKLFFSRKIIAFILLPALPLITAVREYRYIRQAEDEYALNYKIKEQWRDLIACHYRHWWEKIIYFKEYKIKRKMVGL